MTHSVGHRKITEFFMTRYRVFYDPLCGSQVNYGVFYDPLGGLQQNGHKSTYNFFEKKYFKTSITIYSFQELYLRLLNPKKTSIYASGEKVMGVRMYIGV